MTRRAEIAKRYASLEHKQELDILRSVIDGSSAIAARAESAIGVPGYAR
jgi:hypothetical protein